MVPFVYGDQSSSNREEATAYLDSGKGMGVETGKVKADKDLDNDTSAAGCVGKQALKTEDDEKQQVVIERVASLRISSGRLAEGILRARMATHPLFAFLWSESPLHSLYLQKVKKGKRKQRKAMLAAEKEKQRMAEESEKLENEMEKLESEMEKLAESRDGVQEQASEPRGESSSRSPATKEPVSSCTSPARDIVDAAYSLEDDRTCAVGKVEGEVLDDPKHSAGAGEADVLDELKANKAQDSTNPLNDNFTAPNSGQPSALSALLSMEEPDSPSAPAEPMKADKTTENIAVLPVDGASSAASVSSESISKQLPHQPPPARAANLSSLFSMYGDDDDGDGDEEEEEGKDDDKGNSAVAPPNPPTIPSSAAPAVMSMSRPAPPVLPSAAPLPRVPVVLPSGFSFGSLFGPRPPQPSASSSIDPVPQSPAAPAPESPIVENPVLEPHHSNPPPSSTGSTVVSQSDSSPQSIPPAPPHGDMHASPVPHVISAALPPPPPPPPFPTSLPPFNHHMPSSVPPPLWGALLPFTAPVPMASSPAPLHASLPPGPAPNVPSPAPIHHGPAPTPSLHPMPPHTSVPPSAPLSSMPPSFLPPPLSGPSGSVSNVHFPPSPPFMPLAPFDMHHQLLPPPPFPPGPPPGPMPGPYPPPGMLIPPPDVQGVITKLANFIQKNGEAFELKVKEKEKMNPKFSFLLPWNEFHPFYEWILSTLGYKRHEKPSTPPVEAAVPSPPPAPVVLNHDHAPPPTSMSSSPAPVKFVIKASMPDKASVKGGSGSAFVDDEASPTPDHPSEKPSVPLTVQKDTQPRTSGEIKMERLRKSRMLLGGG
eukprot:CAMPEP_0184338400 /NCGR_PEP_ID=MMETSP1089-20130417/6933_1 /TAXON_ID=38269 ORGANISM="Gloeochaete wittrockiana, Strain SAG46.84" /NCGR_SAMPLE_ID=MMETSP1089 /ASSEMBLY_ACC=CAM_ASM_000445 /LENGTH=822 /DNA_ID=CAMNT_0026664889 /DNA_START=764 /DNA_END=3228 /DNA_ORIENTATION=+